MANASTPLLLSVIDTLSREGNEDEREVERERLQSKYAKIDAEVDVLVDEYHHLLFKEVYIFSNISAQLAHAQARVRALQDNLRLNKKLLNCKRDELHKMWIDSIEQRQILYMLNKTDEVKCAPEQLDEFMKKKHYLHATKMVVEKVAMLEGQLRGVDALRDLRHELHCRKEGLHNILIDELHRQLYTRPILQEIVRKGVVEKFSTQKKAGGVLLTLADSTSTPSPTPGSEEDDDEVIENLNGDPEADSSHFMNILIECLAILGRVPDALEAIRNRMHREMNRVTHILADRIASSVEEQGEQAYCHSGTATPEQPKLLQKLLRQCVETFHSIVDAHKICLQHFKRVSTAYVLKITLYETPFVWSAAQYALQVLLIKYFDVENMVNRKTTAFNVPGNISHYFEFNRDRKKVAAAKEARTELLFNFEASNMAITLDSYTREQESKGRAMGELSSAISGHGDMLFLCQPGAANVTVVFNDLRKYLDEIEECLQLTDGKHCALYEFLEEFVRVQFVNEVHSSFDEKVEAATLGLDAHKAVSDDMQLKKLISPKPLFQGAVVISTCLARTRQLTDQLPPYSSAILRMGANALITLRDHSQSTFRSLVRLGNEQTTPLISARWILDEEMLLAFRVQPSWQMIKHRNKRVFAGLMEDLDIKMKFDQETEMLVQYLTDTEANSSIKGKDLLLDRDGLRFIASLQESMEWIALQIKREFFSNPSLNEFAGEAEKKYVVHA